MTENPINRPDHEANEQFEQSLRALSPAGGNQLEQVLYQAGWHAALAQAKNVDDLPRLKETKIAARNRGFGVGLAAGLAAGLFTVVIGAAMFRSQQDANWLASGNANRYREPVAQNESPDERVFSPDDSKKKVRADSPLAASPDGLANPNSWLGWWGGLLNPSMLPPLPKSNGVVDFLDVDWAMLPASYQSQKELWQRFASSKLKNQYGQETLESEMNIENHRSPIFLTPGNIQDLF